MALYTILSFPDPRLREIAQPVTEFNDDIQTVIDDMFETMYHAEGVGLAATQIGIAKRIAVIDVSDVENERLVLINPEIIDRDDDTMMTEGCLSVPGFRDSVPRANKCTLKALDRHGVEYTKTATGLLAEAIQHELDHLNGKLYIDYLSPLKRERIRKKLSRKLKG